MPVPQTATSQTLASEPVRPSVGGPRSALPVVEPFPGFLLYAQPLAWEVVEIDGEAVAVPILSRLPLSPGVGGVTSHGDASVAVAQKQARGCIVIRDEWVTAEETADGHPGYLRRLTGRNGEQHHTAWTRPELNAAGHVVWSHDADGYNRWRASLVGKHIPAPDARVLGDMADMVRTRLDRIAGRPTTPGNEAQLGAGKARLEVIGRVGKAAAKVATKAVKAGAA